MELSEKNQTNFEPIAIIGLGAIFPKAKNPTEFWKNIVAGEDLLQDVPADHWLIEDYYDPNITAEDKTYCKRGAFIPDIDFDPVEYGVPPSNVSAIDTAQLLALIAAKQVLGDATAGKYKNMDLSRVGVILGCAALEGIQYVSGRMQRPVWVKALREAGLPESQVQKIASSISSSYTPWQENTFPGLLTNVVAGRIANRFNLGGTNCTTDAACAGSLAAIEMAINQLQLNVSDMAITGGVDTLNDIVMYMCFSKVGALSLSGHCSPFSDKSDGTVLGEGIGLFAFKRLADAERDNDKIYAVIRGLGSSSDGRSNSIYAPLAKGQSKAILRAYKAAGYPVSTVSLIEAHGTGTRAGDVAEFEGLKVAFRDPEQGSDELQYCAIGSVKSQIGHTKSAAGAAGLFKAVMALHHKILPPTIKIEQLNPKLDFPNSPFYANTQTRPWIHNLKHPRRAGVSSFGFGGSNFHVALEEYTGANKALRLRSVATELVVLAAETPIALLATIKQSLAEWETYEPNLSELAQTSQSIRDPILLARVAVVANNVQDLKQKLAQVITVIEKHPQQIFSLPSGIHYGYAINPGKVAFVFPGQGSQYVNMGSDLTMHIPAAMTRWEQIYKQLPELANIVFPKPVFSDAERNQQNAELMQTQWTQPALAVTSLIQLDLLKQLEIAPDGVAGHSFGELVALYTAGAMSEADLLAMAQKRGELMQQAAVNTPGAMLSVSYPIAELLDIIKQAELKITPANFNSPQQLILSGSVKDIEEAEVYLQGRNIKTLRLPVATGFHSSIVKPCADQFRNYLKKLTFNKTNIPVYANTTGEEYPKDAKQIPSYLADQIANPVKFQTLIESLYESGVRTFIEVGPKDVVSNLVTQCLQQQEHYTVALDRKGEQGITSFWNGLGKLFVLGLNPNFAILWQDYRIEVANKAPKRDYILQINGTNYGRPYPPKEGAKALPKPNPELVSSQITSSVTTTVSSTPVISQSANVITTPRVNNQAAISTTKPAIKRGRTMTQPLNPDSINLYQDLQRQLIDSHNMYQKVMAETHMAFLNSVSHLAEHVLVGGDVSGVATTPVARPVVNTPIPQAAPVVRAPAQPAPVYAAPVAPQPVVMTAPPVVAPAPAPAPVYTAPVVQSAPVAAAPAVSKPVAGGNLQDLILDVVVQKTGYPRDVLNLDMAIESDLGIDSIKRVEILSALRETMPNLPELNPSQLSEIKTLRDILTYLEKH